MKTFEFYFEGTINNDETVTAGIKNLHGDSIQIAHSLATYADLALKKLNEPHAAMIILNSFKRFMELNPGMSEKLLDALVHNDGARIVMPQRKDIFNLDPLSGFKKN